MVQRREGSRFGGIGMETSPYYPSTCPGRRAFGGLLIFTEEYFRGKWTGQGGPRNTCRARVLAWPELHCEALVQGCSPPQFLVYRPGESALWLPRAFLGLSVFEPVNCGDSVF